MGNFLQKLSPWISTGREMFFLQNFSTKFCSYSGQLAFLTADTLASFVVLPLSRLRANTLQDKVFYTRSYLYTGNFTISTVKSRC